MSSRQFLCKKVENIANQILTVVLLLRRHFSLYSTYQLVDCLNAVLITDVIILMLPRRRYLQKKAVTAVCALLMTSRCKVNQLRCYHNKLFVWIAGVGQGQRGGHTALAARARLQVTPATHFPLPVKNIYVLL